ncbi:DUF11 domain-containing protein [Candidatus Nomurabacteria bacterium]|nr:DUF11 domain-containing protein [Candidatus Kaiserbacteria bacterium]MCB9810036.1 DUF11 domain-containing protein [Candidatus Nomurabacteria bacterium]
MKNYLKTIASAMVMFALVFSAIASPLSSAVAFSGFDFDSSLDLGSLNSDSGSVERELVISPSFGSGSTETTSSSAGSFSSVKTTCSITASKNNITVGEDVTINWNTSGFTDIKINGEAVSGNSGSKTFNSLTNSTTFKLTAVNSSGSTCTQQVRVICEPPVVDVACTLTPASQTVPYGGKATLNWTTKGGEGAYIAGIGDLDKNGSIEVGPLYKDTTYVLTVKEGLVISPHIPTTCTAIVKVDKPDEPKKCELKVTKSVDKNSAKAGDSLTYTIDVENIGDADCTGGGVKIEDVVDSNLKYISHNITSNLKAGYGNNPVYTSGDRTLHFNGNTLTPGEKGTITWVGKILNPTQCGDFEVKNQAKATAAELNNFKNWAFSQIVKTEVDNDCQSEKKCELKVTKAVDKSTAKVGENIVYTITVENTGTDKCTGSGVKIEDVLDTNLKYIKNTVTSNLGAGYVSYPVYTSADRTLRFNGFVLDPAESGQITVTTKVLNPTQCGDFEVKNQAKATAAELNNFKNWAYSSVVKTTIDNKCNEIIIPKCPYTPADGIVVNFPTDAKLLSSQTEDKAMTAPQSVNLPAGKYAVRLASWDGYTARVSADQPREQYHVVVTNGVSTIATSNDTDDLADLVETAYFEGQVNSGLVLAEAGSKVYAYHSAYPDTTSPNSLVPICAVFKKEEVKAPTCDLFTATPNAITVGDKATLKWETSEAVQVFINNGIGAVPVDGSIEVSPLSDVVYRLTAIGAEDKTVDCEVPVTVSENDVPVCKSFTATPSTLDIGGGNVTLNWEVEKASEVTISPTVGAVGLTGTRNLNVTESTTFKLTAKDVDGDEVSCIAPVAVPDPEPPFTCSDNVSFSASDTSITRGEEVNLNWSTSDVDSVSISVINETSLSGSKTVSPSSDTTYVLTATQGSKSIDCPISIDVTTGGGGGGSVSPKCELEISKSKIKLGEEVTITWDTTRATEVTLEDDRGNRIFSTDDYLASEKGDYYDGSIKVKPTRATEYTLTAERGSKKKVCTVDVELDDLVVLQTRDQQPLVAGISLSQVPYTGFEAGPVLTVLFYMLLVAWALYITYVLVIRKRMATEVSESEISFTSYASPSQTSMKKAETIRPDVFASTVAPTNLPTGNVVIGYENHVEEDVVNPHQVDDSVVTELENRAHTQKALLSSDAVRHFIATTEGNVERHQALDEVIAEAKKAYPLEDGWIVINEARMTNLCVTCAVNKEKAKGSTFIPATVPQGTGSLAEAIVTGNIVAAYEMIGNRPMFALADAAADLDAVYRNRKGGDVQVSNLLVAETENLSDEKIKNMISALTGALDGTYTDEASAVKVAIMKAVKEVA